MEKYSRVHIEILSLWGLVWLACNAAWVHTSGVYNYLFNDSLFYLGVFRDNMDGYLGTPWWNWDIPEYFPLFSLLTLALSLLFPDPFGIHNVALCFTEQALIILATYVAVARLGNLLYGVRAGCISALFFLSFYLVDSAVRDFMADGLLGLAIVVFLCCSVRLRSQRYSVSSCIWWAVALAACILVKWTSVSQWLPFYLLYVLFSVCWEQVTSSPIRGCKAWCKAWCKVGFEVLFWIVIGLVLSYLVFLLNVRVITAVIGIGVAIYFLHSRLEAMTILRRFLIITGLVLSVCAVVWLKLLDNPLQQYLFDLNATYSGSLLEHMTQDWPCLCLEMLNLLSSGVLLPIACAIFLCCCIVSLVMPRRLAPSVRIICLIIVPGLCINFFFFRIVVVRYFMAVLGLFAVVIGGVLAQGWRWWSVPILGWCMVAKLYFMGGWLIAPYLPVASDDYLYSDVMCAYGVSTDEKQMKRVRRKLHDQLQLKNYWADTALFTAYPFCFRELELMYRVCERHNILTHYTPGRAMVAYVFDKNSQRVLVHIDDLVDTIALRRTSEGLRFCGGDYNLSLISLHQKNYKESSCFADTLIIMYRLGDKNKQLDKLEKYVRMYLPIGWTLTEHYESGGLYDVAVFKASPEWRQESTLLFQLPPTPLLIQPLL